MTSRRFKLAAGTAALILCALVLSSGPGSRAQEPEGHFGVGIPEVFLPKYLNFRARQLADAKPHVMRIRLGFVKGLSRSFTAMVGEMAVDLGTGTYSVTLNGLTLGTTYSVWVVDGAEADLTSLPDVAVRLATVLATGPTAVVSGVLNTILPLGFTIDRVLVTPGLVSTGEPLGAGTVNVFQKMFFRRLTLVNDSTGAVLLEDTTTPPPFFALVPDLVAETEAVPLLALPSMLGMTAGSSQVAAASSSGSSRRVKLDKLISQGAELFFEETFRGNGRTCGTCHPASNNFVIDADFIATRPANDPLFVAEFNPALTDLERPQLMRSFGLILENLDGFKPASRFVMRGVPHTLGMQVSLERDTTLPNPPAEMTGWGGDGSPGTGSLREFAIGAVTQHFPKNLERVAGRDFQLPTEHQLDAMEAFQLSLGRDADFDLAKITFRDENVETGKGLFVNGGGNPNFGGRCAGCHLNGGALPGGLNRNFNTNVEDVTHPARSIQSFPKDGGFGRELNAAGTFGNQTFNLTSVVEAADTPPFFHNNLTDTLERVVDFYTGPEFNNPRAPAARFNFDQTQRRQLANFMRALNTLQNIDVAIRELLEILANNRNNPRRETDNRLQTAFEETQDSIDVLREGGICADAVTQLTAARNLIAQAQHSNDTSQRRSLVQQAIVKLRAARGEVASVS